MKAKGMMVQRSELMLEYIQKRMPTSSVINAQGQIEAPKELSSIGVAFKNAAGEKDYAFFYRSADREIENVGFSEDFLVALFNARCDGEGRVPVEFEYKQIEHGGSLGLMNVVTGLSFDDP